MYSISEQTKNQLSQVLYEASIIISSIPESLFDEEMKKIVDIVLHDAKNQINFLDNLKEPEINDPSEFHIMD
jgi:hypothetical protein